MSFDEPTDLDWHRRYIGDWDTDLEVVDDESDSEAIFMLWDASRSSEEIASNIVKILEEGEVRPARTGP